MPAQLVSSTDSTPQESGLSRRQLSLASLGGLLLRLAAAVVGAFTNVLLARHMGVADFGRFTAALAFVTGVIAVADLGLSPVATRISATKVFDCSAVVSVAVYLRLMAAVAITCILVLAAWT